MTKSKQTHYYLQEPQQPQSLSVVCGLRRLSTLCGSSVQQRLLLHPLHLMLSYDDEMDYNLETGCFDHKVFAISHMCFVTMFLINMKIERGLHMTSKNLDYGAGAHISKAQTISIRFIIIRIQ